MKDWPSISRIFAGVLVFQLGIGGLLVIGDMTESGYQWPGFGPASPSLKEPVRPGDQRRRFNPSQPRPTGPSSPLPDRLTLTQIEGGNYRLEGAIAEGDAARLIGLIEEASPAVTHLVLQSGGGSVQDALELGRHIRQADIETQMLAREICYSACPYLLAAGAARDIAQDASVGLHQHYFGQSSILPASFAVEDIQRGQGEVMIYLNEMGIDPLVMQHALTTPPDEIYVLLPEQLELYGFVTPDTPS